LTEEEKYTKMWALDTYRKVSPGLEAQEIFFSYFAEEIQKQDHIIDYGAGTGMCSSGFLEKGLSVTLVDIAPNCLNPQIIPLMLLYQDRLSFVQAPLWDLPPSLPKASFSYCCDVLEHIPENLIDKTLKNISKRTKKGAFFQIFFQPETFGDQIEEELHLTLHDQSWWLKKLSCYFPVYATLSVVEDVRSIFFLGPGKLYKNNS